MRTRVALALALATLPACLPIDSATRPTPEAPAAALLTIERAAGPPGTVRTPDLAAWYPLEIGNRWHYQGTSISRRLQPGQPPVVLTDVRFELTLEMVCEERMAGRTYQVERAFERFANGGTVTAWTRYRQDRHGLWQSALGSGLPPACDGGSGDPAPVAEDQRLRYPLRPGQHWIHRDLGALSIHMTVEGEEMLELPVGRVPAWRIRIDRPGLWEPGRDRSHVWYGRAGYLKLVTHLEDDVTFAGQPAVIVSEHTHLLDEIALAGPGRFAHGADRAGGAAPGRPRAAGPN